MLTAFLVLGVLAFLEALDHNSGGTLSRWLCARIETWSNLAAAG
jgi:hypothetical protein